MQFKRSAGIILHPTSLPGSHGIGDLGPEAYQWINFLKDTGCDIWQVLPLGPTGYGDSPYQCFSAFAGNPYIISPVLLLEERLLTRTDLLDVPEFSKDAVEFGRVIEWKQILLARAYDHFKKSRNKNLKEEFNQFQAKNQAWLEDFSLFMAIKEMHGGSPWKDWPKGLRQRQEADIQQFTQLHSDLVSKYKFQQFIFFRQWSNLRAFANAKGIKIIGDVPIFVSYDSSDVWAHPELFYINKKGLPTVVAGVPPDYFSPTGQLWGNPLYRWNIHKNDGYAWWKSRLRAALILFDVIRLDHFRGFAGYWEVKFGQPTAEIGRWVKGPGTHFFSAIKKTFPDLPIIAEDLGEITPDVIELRERFCLPGMKILQFAFGSSPKDPFLPHNYIKNCVAYSGTHDNDTSLGWYANASEKERDFVRRYLARSGDDIAWDLIRAVWSSVAMAAIAPMQDFLSLGTDARMNYPGKAGGNWSWRMPADTLNAGLMKRIRETNFLYNRLSGQADQLDLVAT